MPWCTLPLGVAVARGDTKVTTRRGRGRMISIEGHGGMCARALGWDEIQQTCRRPSSRHTPCLPVSVSLWWWYPWLSRVALDMSGRPPQTAGHFGEGHWLSLLDHRHTTPSDKKPSPSVTFKQGLMRCLLGGRVYHPPSSFIYPLSSFDMLDFIGVQQNAPNKNTTTTTEQRGTPDSGEIGNSGS